MKTHTTPPQPPHPMNGYRRFSPLLQLTAAFMLAAVAGNAHADAQVSDLGLTMSLSPADAVAGDNVTFTLGVTNHGPQDAMGVRIENQLPSGYTYLNDNGGGAYNPGTGIWTVGSLALQDTVTLQIEATVLADGAHLNMASVTSDSEDPISENNHAMTGIGGLDGPTTGGSGEFIPQPPADTPESEPGDNSHLPIVNGLVYGDGDHERYALLSTSDNGTKLYGYYDITTGRYHAALVVSRFVNDNVVGNREYTTSAGWSPPREFKRITDSEYMGFTLSCGPKSWTWRQAYCAQPGGTRDISVPNWQSNHQVGAGSGTPPPGYVSSSSLAWNLNNHANGNPDSWDVSQGGTLTFDNWKSPFNPAAPDNVIGMEGYPATGDLTFSKTHGWEWAMIYEFSVDLSACGPYPVRLSNVGSHHSPAKSGAEDEPVVLNSELLDWGDLPAPYPTQKASNGPRHEVVMGGAYLGNRPPDMETDGQTNASALGDDLHGYADEDGIRFLTPFVAGSTARIQVTAGTAGYLSAWMDFSGSGTLVKLNPLSVTGPAAVAAGPVGDLHLSQPGDYIFTVAVPSNATGIMPSRWRFTNQSGQGGNSITGSALTGEVEDYMLAAVGDCVWKDANGNGLQDQGETPVDGVTVSLLHADGTPVLDGSGNPVTTVTANGGFYAFMGIVPGIEYRIGFSNLPSNHTFTHVNTDGAGIFGASNSDANPGTGTTASFILAQGDINPNVDAGLHAQACPDRWVAWKEKWDITLGGETGIAANPEGDRYNNLIEYAFCLPPHSGARKPFCLASSITVEGAVDGVFGRTAVGGAKDVTYILEWATELGNPTVWTGSVVLDGSNTYVTNAGASKETVRIPDLEGLTGLVDGQGFVRIRVVLDNGSETGEDVTEVLGWTATAFEPNCQSYNNPYLACAVFTGTISEVSGSDAVFGTSAGPVDLATLLDPAYSYFIEVESGDLEGHRFDIAAGSADTLTLADGPGTTLPLGSGDGEASSSSVVVGSLPAELVGDRIAVHRHRTINDLFPPSGFGASATREAADKVRVFKNGSWDNYWLFDNNGTPVWLKAGANNLEDHGVTVIAPGHGVIFDNKNEATSILAYGEVRNNRFVRPLDAGHSLVGGGFPIDQSANGANGRDMNEGTGFMPTNDFKTADSFFFWRGDFTIGATGYDTYYLLNGSRSNATKRWVKVGDAMLTGRDTESLLLGDRAVFIRSQNGLDLHTMPLPWTP